jgi:hypothetical protein
MKEVVYLVGGENTVASRKGGFAGPTYMRCGSPVIGGVHFPRRLCAGAMPSTRIPRACAAWNTAVAAGADIANCASSAGPSTLAAYTSVVSNEHTYVSCSCFHSLSPSVSRYAACRLDAVHNSFNGAGDDCGDGCIMLLLLLLALPLTDRLARVRP